MEKVKRETNIEILRVIAMLMVVGIHCIGNTAILERNMLTPINDFLCRYFKLLINVANGTFIIITGYYCINKGFKLKRICNLWGRTIFYSLIIFAIVSIFGVGVDTLSSILPILGGKYWFITAYIVLCFIYPFYNILLNNLDRKKWKTLIIIMFTITIVKYVFAPNGIFGHFTTVMLFYTMGGYIRKFVEINKKGKYLTKYFLIGFIGAILGLIIHKLHYSSIDFKSVKPIINNLFFSFQDMVNPISTIMVVFLFLKFRTIEIKNEQLQQLVSYIGPSLFSVYIIHENVNIRFYWLFTGIFKLAQTPFFIPYLLLLVVAVFCICIVIDFIRRWAYAKLKKVQIINKMVNKINEKIELVEQKINI